MRGSEEYCRPFVHENLSTEYKNPARGRQVTCTAPITDGDIILVDKPYVLVPAMIADEPPFYLCSRQECNRRLFSPEILCSEACLPEVVWCSEDCQTLDKARHHLECPWLRKFAKYIRETHGDSNFGLIWMIARMFIMKHLQPSRVEARLLKGERELVGENTVLRINDGAQAIDVPVLEEHFDKVGWDMVWNLDGGVQSSPKEQQDLWKLFADKYLANKHLLEASLLPDEVVALIGKVETNSFGLYPGVTGEYPVISMIGRGDYYGGGIYPTAAMFNHSCCPNVMHKLDEYGRRIFQANRDIEPGEECCISYFDLVEFTDTKTRKAEIARSWSFACDCERCSREGDFELPHFLKVMDFD